MKKSQPDSHAHAPETSGPLRRLLGDYHVTGVFWYRLHRYGMELLPEPGIWFIITFFTSFFFIALRRIRAAIAANLEAVLGPCGWWERQKRIYRTMWNLAWCLSERYEGLNADLELQLAVEGEEIWNRVANNPEGLIMVTAHIGHFEIGARLPATAGQRRVHVIRESELDPKAQGFIRELMAQSAGDGFEVHFVDEADSTFGAQLLSLLRQGDLLALQGDRPRTGGRTVQARLFDRPFPMPVGPAALARAAEAQILPVFVFRNGRRKSRVVVRPPIRVARTKDREDDLGTAIQKITSEVEWAIREAPYQWFCFRKVWD
ncbi:MAG: lysophospholipid acyltransferase family protein [Thermoanaerobaculales bacterium]|nr:lysophospholipid acyltransferase family protein [Thermoanaerobaculales bacterium]